MLACFSVLTYSTSLTAQNESDTQTHRLLHIKFKSGKAAEGMEIGKTYFSRAYALAGHSTEVFEFTDAQSEWDGIIAIPLAAGEPVEGQGHPKAVVEKLIEITGGEAALQEINKRFFALIEQQRIDLVKLEHF